MAARQATPFLGFSRQEHWSGLPLPSPVHESEKWKWSRSVVSDSVRPHRRTPTRLPRPWDSPGKNTGVGCHCLLQCMKVKSEREVAQLCPTLSDSMDCSYQAPPSMGFSTTFPNFFLMFTFWHSSFIFPHTHPTCGNYQSVLCIYKLVFCLFHFALCIRFTFYI